MQELYEDDVHDILFFFMKNYYFIIPLFVAFVTQGIKWLSRGLMKKNWSLDALTKYGGMPSSHSALIGSMLWLLFRMGSIHETSFMVAVVLGFVVLRDAGGLRRKISPPLGHTPKEICVGLFFGVIFTEIIFLLGEEYFQSFLLAV